MPSQLSGVLGGLASRRVSRRAFLRFCAATTTLLALPSTFAPRVAAGVSGAPRIPLIWLRGAGCGGNSEAFMRTANPGIAELLLDSLSVDYLETIMAPAGSAAEGSRRAAMARYPNGYIAIVEGAVSTADDGVYHTIGGRSFADLAREVCDGALATIAVGACAFDGGLPRAAGGSTGAVGVGGVVANPKSVALPGCPVNVANLAATIVHFLAFGALPAADMRGRPLFAYGSLLHNLCERRPHFEFGEFVRDWGDEGAQKGWCLYKLGCKGPQTFSNCPTARYDEGTSWPVQAGHGCIGCHMPDFWDAMGPAYGRLPGWLPFNPDVTVDGAGLALVGGIAAVATAHGAASVVRARRAASRRAATIDATGVVTLEMAPGEEPAPGPAAGTPASGPVAQEPPGQAAGPAAEAPAETPPGMAAEIPVEPDTAQATPVDSEAPVESQPPIRVAVPAADVPPADAGPAAAPATEPGEPAADEPVVPPVAPPVAPPAEDA